MGATSLQPMSRLKMVWSLLI